MNRRMLTVGWLLLSLALTLGRAQRTEAEEVKAGPLRVAILGDISNFDPQSFLAVNFPVIKNLYDSLLEYTPDGKPVPSLATAWAIAPTAPIWAPRYAAMTILRTSSCRTAISA